MLPLGAGDQIKMIYRGFTHSPAGAGKVLGSQPGPVLIYASELYAYFGYTCYDTYFIVCCVCMKVLIAYIAYFVFIYLVIVIR